MSQEVAKTSHNVTKSRIIKKITECHKKWLKITECHKKKPKHHRTPQEVVQTSQIGGQTLVDISPIWP